MASKASQRAAFILGNQYFLGMTAIGTATNGED